MNVYLDTSALVKLYVDEDGSQVVRDVLSAAAAVATSSVAYPEARAALARREREGAFSAADLRAAVADLDRDWSAYVVLEVSDAAARWAGELAERHSLRGFDAVHLACALRLGQLDGRLPGFGCFDRRLARAAEAEGLEIAAPGA